jgi:(p)ppGpp synthase/HD superfamily hydrolase
MRDDLGTMPLHGITEMLGEEGLRARFELEIADRPDADRLRAALGWASELHRDDRRQREPYVNHLLRVAIRVVSHYRVGDADVICAALLHDAVEDHAGEMGGSAAAALAAVADRFGPRVAELVAAVTNPAYDPDRDAHEQYREHVRESLESSPWARVIKLSDFTDNAVGIHWAPEAKARKVAPKYRPLVPDLRELAARPDTPLDDDVKRAIDAQLVLAATRLALLDPPR